MSSPAVANTKDFQITRKISLVMADSGGKPSAIKADSAGTLPTRFALLQVGMWRTPYHGDIMIMPEDLQAFKANFDAGIARAGDGKLGLPINFGHDQGGQAAGWFAALTIEGDTLYADQVTWTDAGKAGLLGGEWKCISAEFYPAGRGGWCDPLCHDEYVENVIEGAALTNIPLFRNLEPVMASAATGNVKPKVFILATNDKEPVMQLDVVRAKDPATLTEEEKTFIAQNKESLSADEQKKFGLEVTAKPEDKPADDANKPAADPANTNTPKEGEQVAEQPTEAQEAAVAASLEKKGFKVVKASTLESLENTAKEYKTDKATQIVKAHIARGAIKADKEKFWVDRLVVASATDRTALEETLDALPAQAVMAANQGAGGEGAGDATSVAAELHEKVTEAVKASEGKLSYTDAQHQVLASNKELADRVNARNPEQSN